MRFSERPAAAQRHVAGSGPKEDAMRLLNNTKRAVGAPARDGPTLGVGKQVWRFVVHVLQMCAVMCVSLVLLGVLVAASAAVLGSSDPRQTAPALSGLVVTLTLAGSMVAWMRFRAMAWRPTLEMAGSTVVVGALLIAGYGLGIVPASQLVPDICGVACLAMIVVMLFRFRLYASHTGHHAHATDSATGQAPTAE
ncbi:MAG: hypothetical protein WCG47_00330 [Dermatophilaceae bacterium]